MDALEKIVLGRVAEYLADFSEGKIENPPTILVPFLKNGIVFSPKPGIILRTLVSKSGPRYFLDKPGSAQLCELFPFLNFNHESEKWQVVTNPDSEQEAKKMLTDLKAHRGIDIVADYAANNNGADFFESDHFTNCYTNDPKKAIGDKLLPDESEGFRYNLPYYLWKETQQVLFQNWTGLVNIGYKPITLTKVKDKVEKTLTNDLSPFLKAIDEVYLIDISAKDAKGYWTKCRISVKMRCDNGFIADNSVDDWITILYTSVIKTCNKVISQTSCHEISHTMVGGKMEDFDPSTINDKIVEAVRNNLLLRENYFGFFISEVGMYTDIALDKEDVKHEDITKKAFIQEQQNIADVIAQDGRNAVAKSAADNKKIVDEQNAKTAASVLDIETAAKAKRFKDLKVEGYSVELEQKAEIVKNLNLGGGPVIANLGDALKAILGS